MRKIRRPVIDRLIRSKGRKKRLPSKTLVGAAAAVVTVLIFISLIVIDRAIRPAAIKKAEHLARMNAGRVIASAVSDYLAENSYSCGDFAAVLYDDSGRAVSVETLSCNVNRVQSELELLISDRLAEGTDSYIEIPLGSITGSYLLSGKGPRIHLRYCPAGSVSVRLKSCFESGGVNQICHRICAGITADISAVTPLYSFETEESFDVLLAETVIVGDVPDIYASEYQLLRGGA